MTGESRRVTIGDHHGRPTSYALTNDRDLAVSFSWASLSPAVLPNPVMERVASGILDGEYIVGVEAATHRSTPIEDSIRMPCRLIASEVCYYNPGSALWAIEVCRHWLKQGADEEWIWRYLDRHYREAAHEDY